jgi:hypothetical protein
MQRGYIKLWRKSLESNTWNNQNVWRLWCWCLMKASYKRYKCLIGLQEIELMPGQFIFGRKKCSIETGLSEQIVRSCLQTLKSTSNLTIKTTNKFSIITIINWDTYQVDETEFNQQITNNLTNNQPTNNQQITTYKNIKNVKNLKEDNISAKRRHKIPPDFELNEKLYSIASSHGLNGDRVKFVFEHFKAHHESRGTTMLDWNKAWLTWVINDKKFSKDKTYQPKPEIKYNSPEADSERIYGKS